MIKNIVTNQFIVDFIPGEYIILPEHQQLQKL